MVYIGNVNNGFTGILMEIVIRRYPASISTKLAPPTSPLRGYGGAR